MPTLTDDSVKLAVEIAKAGMPMSSGSLLTNPEVVAKFVEVVAKKIHELKMSPNVSPY